jgi:hypothetical protein
MLGNQIAALIQALGPPLGIVLVIAMIIAPLALVAAVASLISKARARAAAILKSPWRREAQALVAYAKKRPSELSPGEYRLGMLPGKTLLEQILKGDLPAIQKALEEGHYQDLNVRMIAQRVIVRTEVNRPDPDS